MWEREKFLVNELGIGSEEYLVIGYNVYEFVVWYIFIVFVESVMGKKLVFFLVLVKRCLCVLKMWLRLEYFCSVFLVLDLIVVLKGVVSVV